MGGCLEGGGAWLPLGAGRWVELAGRQGGREEEQQAGSGQAAGYVEVGGGVAPSEVAQVEARH